MPQIYNLKILMSSVLQKNPNYFKSLYLTAYTSIPYHENLKTFGVYHRNEMLLSHKSYYCITRVIKQYHGNKTL